MKNADEASSKKATEIWFSSSTESKPSDTSSVAVVNLATKDVDGLNAKLACPDKTAKDPEKHSTSKNNKVCPKPAIPHKPEHLRLKGDDIENSTMLAEMKIHCREEQCLRVSIPSRDVPERGMSGKATELISSASDSKKPEVSEKDEASIGQKLQTKNPVEITDGEVDEEKIDFQKSLKKFDQAIKVSLKTAPTKPKRLKANQNKGTISKQTSRDNVTPKQQLTHQSCSKSNNQVAMRENKVKMETEEERCLRLSVHMDEIVRGNITAATEIFDHLRKQEELQEILNRLEEMEQDTSNVDVGALREIFEKVPALGEGAQHKKEKPAKVEQPVERSSIKHDAESMSSMAHAFGDLERASEEIMNLKEQTLARLLDIDDAIKKALYSVSTLKSHSDIAGLSGLFKESLRKMHGSTKPAT